MSQTENPEKPKTTKSRNPRINKSAENQTAPNTKTEPKCYVHDEVGFWEINDIRKNVCNNEEFLNKHTDGKYYCLFHLPTNDKDAEKFKKAFDERLRKVAEVKTQKAEDSEKASSEPPQYYSYDFRYFWFPVKISLRDNEFSKPVFFDNATFTEMVDFSNVKFQERASFTNAKFLDKAFFNGIKFFAQGFFRSAEFIEESDFSKTLFYSQAYFDKSIFSKLIFQQAIFFSSANFRETKFKGPTWFALSTFQLHADFSFAEFLSGINFIQVKFSKIGETSFRKSRFLSETYFNRARFRNKVSFSEAVFEKESDIRFIRTFFANIVDFQYCTGEGYLRFANLRQGEESKFDFQEAAFEKASRVSFHTVRLQPTWFVNTDCRKFVFTACRWKKADGNKIRTKSELKNIENIENRHKLLTKTCWQLADNHEEMKSFPKASMFRQIANESKRREDFKGWSIWTLHWWYWFSSFYGERPLQAGLILLGILLLFAVAFMLTDFQICPIVKTIPETLCEPRTLTIWEASMQSLATATFQNIEYIKPNSKVSTFVIILEKIFAPLQAALLALAIRRKFMR